MTHLVVGVIGHVDHGKTALVQALTGEDTDRLIEEKQRGISIALGFSRLQVGSAAHIDLIDMPGHDRFVRTMISGATGIDAILLVLAANEGIKPQTVEHVEIASLLGLRRALLAVSKIDLVTQAQAQQVADDAIRLLTRAGFDPLTTVMTSALLDEGIEDLRLALNTLAADQLPHPDSGFAYLPIDRAFSVPGHGPVVTGTMRGARVSIGDTLELLTSRRAVQVRAIQLHGISATTALPGQRVALNLRDIEIAGLKRGMALATPESLTLSNWLTISIRSIEGVAPLKNAIKLRAILGTSEVDVRLRLLDGDILEGGQMGFAQLHCAEPVAVPSGEYVILRLASPPQTVAGGRVLEPETQRQQRKNIALLKRLDDLRTLPPEAMIAAEVQRNGSMGTKLRHLSQLCALAPANVAKLLQPHPIVVTRTGWVVSEEEMQRLLSRIPLLLGSLPNGLSSEKLLSALGTSAALLDEALARLLARGVVSKRGSQLLVVQPEQDRARAIHKAELESQISETLRRGGLAPPDPSAIVTDLPSKRAVDHLLREGILVLARDRAKGKEILFHQDAIREAQRRLAPLLQRAPGLLVTEVGAALGISRKYSMPLLDHLDTIKFTRRINDRRIRGVMPSVVS